MERSRFKETNVVVQFSVRCFNVPHVLFFEEVFYGSSHYLSIETHESGNISHIYRNTCNDVHVLHNLGDIFTL